MDLSFWTELCRRKLEDWKLDDKPKQIYGKYKINNFQDSEKASLWFDSNSFNMNSQNKDNLS
jgi:hypothetical protein